MQLDARTWRALALLAATGLLAPACRDDVTSPEDGDETGGGTADTGSSADAPDDGPDDGSDDNVDDGTDGTDDGTDDGMDDIDIVPDPGGLRRLLSQQYIDSVDYLLGPAAAAAATPPNDPSLGGFDSLATTESVPSPADVESYEDSAGAIAEAVVADPAYLASYVPCITNSPGNACYTTLATDFGRLAWRRPLTGDQVATLVDVAHAAQDWDNGTFMTGVQYMLTAILQAPNFIYLVEIGETVDDNDFRELDDYEMATRMSFFLLGRTPSADVLAQAEAGGLSTDEDVRALAWDMIESSQSRMVVRSFYDELLRLRELPTKGKDATLFPNFTPELADAMREETLLLIDDVVFQKQTSVLSLIDADWTFVNEDLAALYGVDAPAPGTWADRTLPAEQTRAGIFTQAGWLTMTAHNAVNSPSRRGLYIEEEVLCTDVPPVPPGVNAMPVVPMEGQTLREALQQHQDDPSCAACHALVDPIGFAFESYDPIGAWRTTDNGSPVDPTGDVAGIGSWQNAAELAALLHDDPRTAQCLVTQWYKFGLGYVPDADQADGIVYVNEQFGMSDHDLKAMLVELVANPVFRWVDEPK